MLEHDVGVVTDLAPDVLAEAAPLAFVLGVLVLFFGYYRTDYRISAKTMIEAETMRSVLGQIGGVAGTTTTLNS